MRAECIDIKMDIMMNVSLSHKEKYIQNNIGSHIKKRNKTTGQ
jgi:hypothetical protein